MGQGQKSKEQFHLAGDHGTGRHGILQGFLKVAYKAGGAHNDILALEAVQIVLAQAQVDAQLPDGGSVISEVLHALFLVAQGNVCPQLHKFLDQGLVADARADKGHLFALDELFELLLILLHKNRSSFVQYHGILNTPELPGICELLCCTIIVHLAAQLATENRALGTKKRGKFTKRQLFFVCCFLLHLSLQSRFLRVSAP